MKSFAVLLAVVAMGLCTARAESPLVIASTNLELLKQQVGNNVVVEGPVTSVGTTPDMGITFINLGLPKKQGFAAVIFQSSYGAFPEGFDKFRGQNLRVKGILTLFKDEIPQIKINSPEQIEIVDSSQPSQ